MLFVIFGLVKGGGGSAPLSSFRGNTVFNDDYQSQKVLPSVLICRLHNCDRYYIRMTLINGAKNLDQGKKWTLPI